MKNRIVSMIAASLLVLTCATGCGERQQGSESSQDDAGNLKTDELKASLDFDGETIKFVYPPGYGMVDPEGKDAAIAKRNAKMKELEQKYNVVIEQREGKGNYWDVMASSIAAGSPVGHILVTQANKFLAWMNAGAFANLNDAMEKTGIDFTAAHYSEESRKLTGFDNKQYGFAEVKPHPTGSFWLFNKRIFKEMQLEDPYKLVEEKKWTWEKAAELATKATKRRPDGTVEQWGMGSWMHFGFLSNLVCSNGTAIAQFDQSGNPVLKLAEPQAMKAFEQMSDWISKDKIARVNDGSQNWDVVMKEFVDGKIAILEGGTKVLQFAQEGAMKDDYGVVYPPLGPDAEDYTVSAGLAETYFIPVTYESMADKLLLLFDDVYRFEDGETVEDRVAEKYMSKLRDKESLKYFTDMAVNPARKVYDVTGMTGLEWTTPSLHEICGRVLKGTSTPGDEIEKNKVQMQKAMEDAMEEHKYTGK